MRRNATIFLSIALVSGAAVLYATSCSVKHSSFSATVNHDGGVIGHKGSIAQLDVPRGSVGSGEVKISAEVVEVAGSPILDKGAVAVGQAVDISVSSPLPGAQVLLPFDAAKDLPERATTANAFIAVYNTTFQSWFPLATTYDELNKRLVATAPHFSKFQNYVVDPAKKLWNATVTGVQMWASISAQWINGQGSALWEMVNGEQESADCSKAENDWSLSSTASEMTGCVITDPTAGGAMRLQSTLRYPMTLVLPQAMKAAKPTTEGKPLDMMIRGLDYLTGSGYLPARGIGDANIPEATMASAEALKVRLDPDDLAIALRTIMSLYSLMVGDAHFVDDVFADATVRSKIVAISEEQVTVHEFVTQVTLVIRSEFEAKNQDVALLNAGSGALEALDCAASVIKAGTNTEGTEEAAKNAIETAKDCVGTALHSAEGQAKEVAELLAAIPDGINMLGGIWDAMRMSALHFGAQLFVTARHSRVYVSPNGPTAQPLYEPTDYPISTDSSNLLSGINWQRWTTDEADGTGAVAQNECVPDCADSTQHIERKVKIVFEKPKDMCGNRYFTELTLTPADSPSATRETYDVTPFC